MIVHITSRNSNLSSEAYTYGTGQLGTYVDPVVLWKSVEDFWRDEGQVSANLANFMKFSWYNHYGCCC